MVPHASEVNHISRQQQSLLYGIGHISSLSMLEISNGGIVGERGSIQHYSGSPCWDFELLIGPLFYNRSLAGGSRLGDLGLFTSPLSLGLLGWRFPSLIHNLLPFLVPLSLFISGLRLEGLCGRKGRGFRLICLL